MEFANKGIACTVLRPDKEDDVVSQASKIAAMADIAVLDWILNGDNGARVSRLMLRMIEGKKWYRPNPSDRNLHR